MLLISMVARVHRCRRSCAPFGVGRVALPPIPPRPVRGGVHHMRLKGARPERPVPVWRRAAQRRHKGAVVMVSVFVYV